MLRRQDLLYIPVGRNGRFDYNSVEKQRIQQKLLKILSQREPPKVKDFFGRKSVGEYAKAFKKTLALFALRSNITRVGGYTY